MPCFNKYDFVLFIILLISSTSGLNWSNLLITKINLSFDCFPPSFITLAIVPNK